MRTHRGVRHRIHQTQRTGDKGKTLVKWCKKIMIPHRKDKFIPLNVEQHHHHSMPAFPPPNIEPNTTRQNALESNNDMMDESQDPAKASVFERAVELNWLKRVFAQRRQQRQRDIVHIRSSFNEQQHDAKQQQQDAEEQSSVVVPPPLFPSESTLNISALFDDPEGKVIGMKRRSLSKYLVSFNRERGIK